MMETIATLLIISIGLTALIACGAMLIMCMVVKIAKIYDKLMED